MLAGATTAEEARAAAGPALATQVKHGKARLTVVVAGGKTVCGLLTIGIEKSEWLPPRTRGF